MQSHTEYEYYQSEAQAHKRLYDRSKSLLNELHNELDQQTTQSNLISNPVMTQSDSELNESNLFTYFDISSLFNEFQTSFQPFNRMPEPRKELIASTLEVDTTQTTKTFSLQSSNKPSFSFNLSGKLKVLSAAFLATMVGITFSILSPDAEKVAEVEQTTISKIMYQNVNAKVAAFRREIAAGDHHIKSTRDKSIQYISREGDTIQTLSKKFHLKPETIVKTNKNVTRSTQSLEPGTKITILPLDGIVHPVSRSETMGEIANRYDVPIKELVSVNDIDNPALIRENQGIVIPNATQLKLRPKPKKVKRPLPPRLANLLRHSKKGSYKGGVSRRGFARPTRGVYTSGFGFRWGGFHRGVDIAAPVGTPIRAARSGVITHAGWMGGYGYAIDISHGNGLKTRYAHCSRLFVRVGQRVAAGQNIAAMGSTGRSTGSHLHFEVHVNGSAVNPKAYL